MKRILLVLIISAAAFSTTNAQTFALGIKAGANIDNVSGQAFTNDFTFGYQAGAFAIVGLSKHWNIHPEVVFSQGNVDTASNISGLYTFDNTKSKSQLSYLNIPILLGYKITKNFTLQAGPQYSILLNQSNSLVQNGKDAFKSGNFSLVGGLEIKVAFIRIYGRYVGGLTNINNLNSQDTWKSQSVQLGLGITIL
jgi:hypothetical protein